MAGVEGCSQGAEREINMVELMGMKYGSAVWDVLSCGRASEKGRGDQHLYVN